MNIPQITPKSIPAPKAPGNIDNNTNQITHLFDISANINSEPLDPDLQQIALSVQNSDIGSLMQSIVIALIRLLAQIRKQQQQIAQSQANVAFSTAQIVAQHQKDQAKQSATAEMVNAGVGMIQGALDGAVAGYQGIKSNAGLHAIQEEANSKDWSTGANNGAGTRDGEVATPAGKSAKGPEEFTLPEGADVPPAYTEKAGDKPAETLKTSLLPTKPGDDEGNNAPADAPANTPAAPVIDEKAKAAWINDAARNMYSKLDIQQRALSAVIAVLTNSIKQFSGMEQINAGQSQALATVEQAAMQYLQTQSGLSSDYASEMREAIRGVLDLIKNIEQSRHQASSAIIQIV